ncbi:MAG: PTS sugar transporter subunit IIC [Elusimicrobiota bacterium]
MDFIPILKIAAVGSLLSLDATVIGQFMVSRPIVAGPVIGWFCGDIKTGLLVGVLIELLWIGVVPVGVGVPPDSTIVSIVATALSCNKTDTELALAIILAVPLGIIFKRLDIMHRKYNRVFLPVVENGLYHEKYYLLTVVIWLSIFFTFVKGFLSLIISILLLQIVLNYILPVVISQIEIVSGLKIFLLLLPVLGLSSFLAGFVK